MTHLALVPLRVKSETDRSVRLAQGSPVVEATLRELVTRGCKMTWDAMAAIADSEGGMGRDQAEAPPFTSAGYFRRRRQFFGSVARKVCLILAPICP